MATHWEDLPKFSRQGERTLSETPVTCRKCQGADYTLEFVGRSYPYHEAKADLLRVTCQDCGFTWLMRPADGVAFS